MIDDGIIDAAVDLVRRTQAIHVDKRAARPLKKVNAKGEVVGEVGSDALLAGLLAKEQIQVEELKTKERAELDAAWKAIKERRAAGLTDLCAWCHTPLSMRRDSVAVRDRGAIKCGRLHFRCRPCAAANTPDDIRALGIAKAVLRSKEKASAVSPAERARRASRQRELTSNWHRSNPKPKRGPKGYVGFDDKGYVRIRISNHGDRIEVRAHWASTPNEARPRAVICAKIARQLRDADVDPRPIIKLLAAEPDTERIERLIAEIRPAIEAAESRRGAAIQKLVAKFQSKTDVNGTQPKNRRKAA